MMGRKVKDLEKKNKWVHVLVNNGHTLTEISEKTGISISWLSMAASIDSVMLPIAKKVIECVNSLCQYLPGTTIINPNFTKLTLEEGWDKSLTDS